MEKVIDKLMSGNKTGKVDEDNLQGYPSYPDGEDIYHKYQERKDINPEGISNIKEINDNKGLTRNEKHFDDDAPGGDLDIPGSELDDEQETVGSEDEENNYYSLGGDDHNNLDEDKEEL